jgi:hypothetical protein
MAPLNDWQRCDELSVGPDFRSLCWHSCSSWECVALERTPIITESKGTRLVDTGPRRKASDGKDGPLPTREQIVMRVNYRR